MGIVKTLIENKYIDVSSRNDVSNYICTIYLHCNIAVHMLGPLVMLQ